MYSNWLLLLEVVSVLIFSDNKLALSTYSDSLIDDIINGALSNVYSYLDYRVTSRY